MQSATPGATGLRVSRVGYGTWQLGGDWGSFDEDAATRAIRHARDLGVNFFDTEQAYGFGASERLLGHALRRNLAVVARLSDSAAERGHSVSRLAIACVPARVDVAIVGARSSGDIEAGAAAAGISLSDGELAEIERIAADGAQIEGAGPEGVA